MLRKIITGFCLALLFSSALPAGEKMFVAAEDPFCRLIRDDFFRLAFAREKGIVLTNEPARVATAVLGITAGRVPPDCDSRLWAVDGMVVIVHEVNSFRSLPLKSFELLRRNRFPKWPEVEIPLRFLAVVAGTFPEVQDHAQKNALVRKDRVPVRYFPTPAAAAKAVAAEPAAAALLCLTAAPFRFPGTRILASDGVQPEMEQVFSGKYKAAKVYRIFCRKDAPADIRAFYENLCGKVWHARMRKIGVLPVL